MKSEKSVSSFYDWGMVVCLCAAVFILPASIAMLDSFAALAILFYLAKKINRLAIDWHPGASRLSPLGKMYFIWKGLAPPVNSLNLPLQFLALAFFISVLFSLYPKLSLFAFFGKFVKCVLLYFCFIEALSNEKRIGIFLNIFFLSAGITALSGAVEHYTGKDFLKGHTIGTENFVSTHRINSTFFSANGFGAYLLPVLGLVIHYLFTAVFRKRSWVLGGVLALFLVLLLSCLCWTYSRSAWVGFVVLLVVMLALDWRKILLAGSLILVFTFFFLPSLSNIRHLHLINDNNAVHVQKTSPHDVEFLLNEGGSGRLAYWKKAISIIRLSPVWGTGLNTYTKLVERDPDSRTWWYAHNCYLQMTAETGLLGVVCFLWMLCVLLMNSFSSCKHIKDPYLLTFLQGSIAGLSAFLVQSFFDNTFYTVQLSMLMWMIFGLMAALIRVGKNR